MKPITCDAHCDALWIKSGYALRQSPPTVDPLRMKFGGLDRVVLALYMSDQWQDSLGDTKTWEAIQKQILNARMAFPGQFIALEGGRCLGKDPIIAHIRLRQLAKDGIKYLTLTHNSNNALAGSSTAKTKQGLTKLGYDIMEECEFSGIFVDVSHASDETFAEVAATSSKPVIASHSGCKSILRHPRNLTDTQLLHISLTNGIVGVPFVKKFVGTLDGVAQHVDHICQVTGAVKHVCIGSDLDGAEMVEGVHGAQDWSKVVLDGLSLRGFTDEAIMQIAGGNLMRLFGEAE